MVPACKHDFGRGFIGQTSEFMPERIHRILTLGSSQFVEAVENQDNPAVSNHFSQIALGYRLLEAGRKLIFNELCNMRKQQTDLRIKLAQREIEHETRPASALSIRRLTGGFHSKRDKKIRLAASRSASQYRKGVGAMIEP